MANAPNVQGHGAFVPVASTMVLVGKWSNRESSGTIEAIFENKLDWIQERWCDPFGKLFIWNNCIIEKTTYIIYTIHNTSFPHREQKVELPEVAVQCFDDGALKFMLVKYFLWRLVRLLRWFLSCFYLSVRVQTHTYWYIWAVRGSCVGKSFDVWIWICHFSCGVMLITTSFPPSSILSFNLHSVFVSTFLPHLSRTRNNHVDVFHSVIEKKRKIEMKERPLLAVTEKRKTLSSV